MQTPPGDERPTHLQPSPLVGEEAGQQPKPKGVDTPAATPASAPTPRPQIFEAGLVTPRIRRPYDLLFALGWLLITAAIVAIGYLATATAAGIETDLTSAGTKLPSVIRFVLNVGAGLGVFLLPLAAGIEAVLRRRFRALLDASIAVVATLALTSVVSIVITQFASERFILALAGSTNPARGTPTSPILAALVTLLIAGRISSRAGWRTLGWLVIGSTVVITILTGGISATGVLASAAFGSVIGHVCRWILGSDTTRASGEQITETLARYGFSVTALRVTTRTQRGRHYVAQLSDGRILDIRVLDRDLAGGDIWQTVVRGFRVRGIGGSGISVQRTLERSALMAYAVSRTSVAINDVCLVCHAGSESSLIASIRRDGQTLANIAHAGGTLTELNVSEVWKQIQTLHGADIALRNIGSHTFALNSTGTVHVTDASLGTVAANDVQRRMDIASALVVLASLASPDLAVRSARNVLGDEAVIRALPALQRFALSTGARTALKAHRGLLRDVQQKVVAIAPDAPVDDVRIERLKPRTLVSLLAGTVAGYLLITQLGHVDVAQLVSRSQPGWLLFALALSFITYVGTTMTYLGFVPEKLRFGRTLAAQFATSFANLMTPASVGSLAINTRYIRKSGVNAALAVASVGLVQVAGAITYVLMLVTAVFTTGARHDIAFTLPRIAVVVAVAIVVLIVGSLSISKLRKPLLNRMRPLAQQVLPRLVTVAQNPNRLAMGVGGQIIVTLSYIAALSACVNALGGNLTLPATAVVYLAGYTLGQAVPTPGGIGGVEAVMSAALAAAGLDVSTAISVTLLFRLVTFWLPIVPGWFAFRRLTKLRAI